MEFYFFHSYLIYSLTGIIGIFTKEWVIIFIYLFPHKYIIHQMYVNKKVGKKDLKYFNKYLSSGS